MIHSVGCPQPKASAFINNWNKPEAKACVHAIVEPGGNDGKAELRPEMLHIPVVAGKAPLMPLAMADDHKIRSGYAPILSVGGRGRGCAW